jgi:hypothetical protein
MNDIIDEAESHLRTEIDNEVIFSILESMGWKSAEISKSSLNEHIIDKWLDENCIGVYKSHFNKFIFEDHRDYIMFTLRWS